MTPNAIVPEGKTVVRRVDENRVFQLPSLPKGVDNFTNTVIDQAHLAEIIAQRFHIVRQEQGALELLPYFSIPFLKPQAKTVDNFCIETFAGNRSHPSLIVKISKLVLSPPFDSRPMAVGSVVRYEGEKWPLLVFLALQKFNGFVSKKVDGVTGKSVSFFLINHIIVVETCRMTVGERYPMIECQLRFERHTQMELSDHRGGVTRLFDECWEIVEFTNRRPVLRPMLHQCVIQPIVHTVLAWHQAGQCGSPARGTHGVHTIGIIESDTLTCQRVNMGRLNLIIAVTSQQISGLVI